MVLILAVSCAIEMGLPVCISAKGNLYLEFAHITVMSTKSTNT